MMQLAGKAKLAKRWAKLLGGNAGSDPAPILNILDNVTAVESLAALLTQAIETKMASDGRIDMRDVAAYVLDVMKRNPK